jgi:hypothetical protein
VTTLTDAKDAGGNCFSGNQFHSSLPPNLEDLVPCGSPPSPSFIADIGRFAAVFTAEKPKGVDYKVVRLPSPPLLEDMPDAANAPARPADADVPMHIDLSGIAVPTR